MLIDAKNREYIIVTKAKNYAKVFKTALDSNKHSHNIMKDTGIRLRFQATDATSSKDGQVRYKNLVLHHFQGYIMHLVEIELAIYFFLQVIIIRKYWNAFLWPRRKNQHKYSIVDILKQKACEISVGHQKQGESVALAPDGKYYYAHSEHQNQPFWKFHIYGGVSGGGNHERTD